MTTIVFANQKGGVTKTTSAANVAAALAERGERVLVVDADPQANLSEAFGVGEDALGPRLEDLLEHPPDVAPAPIALDCGVALIATTAELATVAAELASQDGAEYRLRDVLGLYADGYDFVLIDTPPSVGPLSTMALIAADWVIVPARPAKHDLASAGKVYDLVESGAFADHNPTLRILGVLIVLRDSRWVLRRQSHDALAGAGMTRLPVEIPFAVRVGAAPEHGVPTVVLEPDSRVAHAYRELAAFVCAHTRGTERSAA